MRERIEQDSLGSRELPADALWGIHTSRAMENFQLSCRTVDPALIHAYGEVKLACAMTNRELGFLSEELGGAIESACRVMAAGGLDRDIRVDALQGGAGTSTNMNVNEVLANHALRLLDSVPGAYARIHPLDHVNLHQSTNDTYPTALKIAAIKLGKELETALVALLEAFQRKEKEFAHIVKIGRTEMQDAVLTTLGRGMSAYAEAFGRDRWRVFKCEERLRGVNLGGTAIGSGLAAPRRYIFRVTENLRTVTGLGLARAENLIEATQNTDAFVEVGGILSACAANLFKVANDIRFMGSGPDAGIGELILPSRQAGSSIMPGKVNPVIPEAVIQAAMAARGHLSTLERACSMGHLELNAFMPLIADCLLTALRLLTNAADIFARHCVDGLKADEERCRLFVENSTATATALVAEIGYDAAGDLAKRAAVGEGDLKSLVVAGGLMSAERFDELVSPEAVNRLGSVMVCPST